MPLPSDAAPPVLGAAARTAEELAAALRREFEREMLDRHGQAPQQDPVLATLFHATAVQLARVYAEAEQLFPEAVFDDLVGGLGMPPRAAQPAQTVVQFVDVPEPELVTADVPLLGLNRQGETIPFAVDVPMRVGPTTLAFAGVVEQGRLHAVAGATIPGTAPSAGQPGLPLPAGSVPLDGAAAAMSPTLLLAFDVGAGHLGGVGLFLDVQGDDAAARALARSAWQLLGPDGAAREALVLRARRGAGGVHLLDWERPPAGEAPLATLHPAPPAAGAFGPLCWVWPDVPPERRARTRAPRTIARALAQLVAPEHAEAWERPLAWVQVALPGGTRGVAAALQRVLVNATAASNLEAYAERVALDRLGAVVSFRPEGSRTRHAIAVLGVTGEQGSRYVEESDPTAAPGQGRYRFRGGQLEVRAARGATGRFDRYVMARLLYTDGERGNGLEPGDVTRLGAALGAPGARVTNATAARGGTPPPAYAPAKVRFAELLRTRERAVTAADYDVVARAFEPRVRGATVRSVVEPGEDRVPRRVEVVTVRVSPEEFGDPGAELPRLAAALEAHLQGRAAIGTVVRVEVG